MKKTLQRVLGSVLAVVLLLSLLPVFTAVAEGNTITVNPDGSKDYTTIQEALDAAGEGDIVELDEGIYQAVDCHHYYVGLTKPVTLQAAEGANVVIVGSTVASYVVRILSDNVVVRGISIQAGASAPNNRQYALKVEPNQDPPIVPMEDANILIEDVTILSSIHSGIDINGIDGVTVRGVTVSNLTKGNAISVSNSQNITITDCDFSQTGNTSWGNIALYLSNAFDDNKPIENITITDCTYNDSYPAAYHQTDGSRDSADMKLTTVSVEDYPFVTTVEGNALGIFYATIEEALDAMNAADGTVLSVLNTDDGDSIAVDDIVVFFYPQGGAFTDSTTEAKLVLAVDGIITPPSVKRDNYNFGGWYTDETLTTKWNFNNVLENGGNAYAKWTEIPIIITPPDVDEPDTFTVTFNSQGGSAVAAQTVEDGSVAVKPADPAREGYTFDGWFTDADCTKAFAFTTAITANITLYAKWNYIWNADAPSTWAQSEVISAIELGLVPEDLQQGFKGEMNRLNFCRMAIEFLTVAGFDFSEIEPDIAFNDCDEEVVLLASALGIVEGTGHGDFEPDRDIRRDEAACMLSRLCDVLGEYNADAAQTEYADQNEIHSWARGPVNFMFEVNVMTGASESKFDPTGLYTTETAIVTFERLYQWLDA